MNQAVLTYDTTIYGLFFYSLTLYFGNLINAIFGGAILLVLIIFLWKSIPISARTLISSRLSSSWAKNIEGSSAWLELVGIFIFFLLAWCFGTFMFLQIWIYDTPLESGGWMLSTAASTAPIYFLLILYGVVSILFKGRNPIELLAFTHALAAFISILLYYIFIYSSSSTSKPGWIEVFG